MFNKKLKEQIEELRVKFLDRHYDAAAFNRGERKKLEEENKALKARLVSLEDYLDLYFIADEYEDGDEPNATHITNGSCNSGMMLKLEKIIEEYDTRKRKQEEEKEKK